MSDVAKLKGYAKRIPLFNGLEPEEVEDILKQGHTVYFQKGQTIFHEGQRGQNLFIVFGGKVDILSGLHHIATCGIGDVFGEMSVLDHRPHTATALAQSDVKLFTLEERQINRILEKRVAVRFLLNVIHVLCGHLERTNHELAELEKRAGSAGMARRQQV